MRGDAKRETAAQISIPLPSVSLKPCLDSAAMSNSPVGVPDLSHADVIVASGIPEIREEEPTDAADGSGGLV